MDLVKALKISASGLRAQTMRMRVSAENMANADTMSETAGGDPYRRKTISFKNVLDKTIDAKTVKVDKLGVDKTDFDMRFDPGHPAADANGYVKLPNVKSMVELMDIREAQRSYEANLGSIEAAKNMLSRAIDLLRG
ncbi:MAG TPA: flagellar basal body rod protein FlgC [Alphaproteobacteria bacterium]|nr:flagellar basal body rod protein FlgC [Alphaproteobacteria bacterium]